MATQKGIDRRREPWREVLVDELTDEDEAERRDFKDPYRNPFESEHGPVMGNDGDDNPTYAGAKAKFDSDKLDRGDISDPVQPKQHPADNFAGQMVEDGHGFLVDDPRSRPWKTAPRTHCKHCGGEMPAPDLRKYRCEFEWDIVECSCNGCALRALVLEGHERGKGQPRKYCSPNCTRLAGNERNSWKRAVERADKRGEQPPPEPEDRGLKFTESHRGVRSAIEGAGHRYVAATGGLQT